MKTIEWRTSYNVNHLSTDYIIVMENNVIEKAFYAKDFFHYLFNGNNIKQLLEMPGYGPAELKYVGDQPDSFGNELILSRTETGTTYINAELLKNRLNSYERI
jgi:hypothetical protein